MTKIYSERAAKIQQRIDELALFTDNAHYLNRTFGSQSFIKCGNKIEEWMKEAGLETRVDNIGNIRGKLYSNNPSAKTFVIASHFDTTYHAGKYNGVLGIIMGIDLAENIQANKISLPYHLEIIAFSEEEGVRFHTGYLGSKVIAGNFKNKFFELKDNNGHSLSQVLHTMNKDISQLKSDAIPPDEWMSYFEIHIEQGRELIEKNIPVGIISTIVGQKKIEITFAGESGHAGVVPMNLRKDALCAVARFITGVEKYALKEKSKVMATVGEIKVVDAVSNQIPAIVNCTLDIRSEDEKLLSDAYETINQLCEKICFKRNIYFEWNLVQETEPVQCNKKLRKILSNSIEGKKFETINLVSGAVHDAAIISEVAPVVMLLVRCLKGNGHAPMENVEDYDISSAVEISDHFILQLVNPNEKTEKKK